MAYPQRIFGVKVNNMNCYCIRSKSRFNILVSNYRVIAKTNILIFNIINVVARKEFFFRIVSVSAFFIEL